MPIFEKKYGAIVLASMSAPVMFSSQKRVRSPRHEWANIPLVTFERNMVY